VTTVRLTRRVEYQRTTWRISTTEGQQKLMWAVTTWTQPMRAEPPGVGTTRVKEDNAHRRITGGMNVPLAVGEWHP
jgi:hypothetical protein